MAISSRKAVVFNIAAIVVAASAVGAVVRSWVVKPSVAPCETRYSNVLAFKLERDGKLVSPIDLQGRSGGRDSGLDRNVEITRVSAAPKPTAMKVTFPADSTEPSAGMSFPWEPTNIRPHAATCVAYNVMISEGFDTGTDGVLPAVHGVADDGVQRFAIGPAWMKNGDIGLAFDVALKPAAGEAAQDKASFNVETTERPLPKGRWVRVNQELVMNAPDASDGIVRLWVDGKLVADRTDVRMRSDAGVALTGITARAQVLGDSQRPAPKPGSSIAITPFELMW